MCLYAAVILNVLTTEGPTSADDLKHACRIVPGFHPYVYSNAVYALKSARTIEDVSPDYSTEPVWALRVQ